MMPEEIGEALHLMAQRVTEYHKFKTIILLGQSGCGKSTIVRELQKHTRINYVVPTTTRPSRLGEEAYIDYDFIDKDSFLKRESRLIGVTNYNEWFYAYDIMNFEPKQINIIIGNLKILQDLLEEPRLDILQIYYINVPEEERLIRSLKDENHRDVDEIMRRYTADKQEFYNFQLPLIHVLTHGSRFRMMPNVTKTDFELICKDILDWAKLKNA